MKWHHLVCKWDHSPHLLSPLWDHTYSIVSMFHIFSSTFVSLILIVFEWAFIVLLALSSPSDYTLLLLFIAPMVPRRIFTIYSFLCYSLSLSIQDLFLRLHLPNRWMTIAMSYHTIRVYQNTSPLFPIFYTIHCQFRERFSRIESRFPPMHLK